MEKIDKKNSLLKDQTIQQPYHYSDEQEQDQIL